MPRKSAPADTTAAKPKPKPKTPPVAPAPTYPRGGTPSKAKPPKEKGGEPKSPLGRLAKFVRGGYTKKGS